ncbi:MAG: RNA polymerase sigma factor [Gammaproteobacteria bacterium]|nr:RNA polymerase sigma factor [Gammaproteobacteria bacterium]NNF49478.1 RNA polymerase sigma factor [Woeseiaceae bacterium]MBT8093866.1 RNA polymerase sigma factor [Gammaproteobacteria bacterium]MBT8105943.1 RNA polymerase sigma factor [Gammaproteobacteria bacterium]NNK25957.1 RNA polymerase sigma factor [Woeseiaceae bacterium]
MAVWLDDKRLVKQLLAGDERAFDRFFDENFARLYRFALLRLSDDEDAAREVAQITLSKAVRKLHTYRAEAALFTWLCSICRNVTSDWLTQQGRYREHIVLTEDFPEVQAAVDSLRVPEQMSPERHFKRVELLRLIQVALDRLPPKYGDVLEWKYIEEHSVKEIATRMGIGTEAAQSLIARAKRAFAEVYSSLIEGLEGHKSELVKL